MKNISTTLATTGALCLAALAGQAQTSISFGPRLGANLTTFSYSGESIGVENTSSRVGVQVGGTANIAFGNFAFQPSLLFTQKGAKLTAAQTDNSGGYTTTASVEVKPRLHYLELPLNMVYTSEGDHGFQLFAGPYVALGVGGGGSYQVSLASTDPQYSPFAGTYPGSLTVEYGDRQNDNSAATGGTGSGGGVGFGAPTLTLTAHRFDAGLNGGIGYRVGPVQAQLGYSLGLVNFVPKGPDGEDTGSKAYHRGFQLAATYFLPGK
ncbi:MAG TPA: porin family protein [Hymenobacter sp.]|uniref:porin family protein n=1 Tax=Hymenobacter sp. TaxID=1898978 RepID=UPI002D80EB70|nr:porin family protein [Hymenobacter sp.]HET9505304.1 porin family protein [Hymenobacter sp.]